MGAHPGACREQFLRHRLLYPSCADPNIFGEGRAEGTDRPMNADRSRRQRFLISMLSLTLVVGVAACDVFKQEIPPNEMFTTAERQRENEEFLEAAQTYDALIAAHEESELVPAALFYSGICKFTLSLRAPGPKAFEQRKGGLSDAKQEMYTHWLDYLEKYDDNFSYIETLDTYLYQGNEFKILIEQHPASNYVDDAAYQLVHTHFLAKQRTKTLTLATALQLYHEFFAAYPQSPYVPKGIEHLMQFVADYDETILDAEATLQAYQEVSQTAERAAGLGRLAYLLAKIFLQVGDTTRAATLLDVPSVIGIGIVDTKSTRLNIRSGQGTEFRIVAKADKGEEVLLLSQAGQWYNVRLQDGTIGYAHSEYIRKLQPTGLYE
ncbi:SH3 domain-containing protein [candidate division KSB3 bacterium]|uniref:SH3 domain-containing protein n=1 Tax=candidate division KSB3 bacterium TaxID=2044937 RepID=A0A9D5Q5E5_9BACT|nr:SH3 domain-containing protein [candidate division KSB3 bacterium]MBD3324147.1 SH3 domain-containing protein [candidate division KSB3 bacterium]